MGDQHVVKMVIHEELAQKSDEMERRLHERSGSGDTDIAAQSQTMGGENNPFMISDEKKKEIDEQAAADRQQHIEEHQKVSGW